MSAEHGGGVNSEPALRYPLDFPIKVMGRHEPRLVQSVVDIVRRHAPDFDPATVEMRVSKKNNYLSVTCVVRASSRDQLDALYRELCDHPTVVMVL
jgi:putative lipoic acid-binding regulatory protein